MKAAKRNFHRLFFTFQIVNDGSRIGVYYENRCDRELEKQIIKLPLNVFLSKGEGNFR